MDSLSLNPAADASDGAAEFPDGAEITSGVPPTLESQLVPGNPLHSKVLQRLKARLDLSHRNRSSRYDDWDRVDEKRRLYVNLARPARKGDNTSDINKLENPFERAIVMPMTYAISETRVSEVYSQYAFRSPFTTLDGRGIEDVKPAKLAEIKLQYDYLQSDGDLSVYQMIKDADGYGEGIIYDTWDEENGWNTVPPDPVMVQLNAMIGAPPPEPTMEWGPIKQFTRWAPCDPYMTWPDPRVTRANLQTGEFFGHRAFRSQFWLEERSQENGGNYFNLDKLKKEGGQGQQSADSRLSTRARGTAAAQFSLRGETDEKDKGFVILDCFQVRLNPKEWGVGDGTQPEIWWFAMADESIIVRAHKSPYMHNQFTYAVGESNFDIHQYANPGTVEMLDGLQRTTDWLVNSRIENVRKFINDMLAFSPELMEQDDIENPGPGRWFRMTPAGTIAAMQGLSLDNMIRQFPVSDVTGAHFEVTQFLMDMANKLGAANDTMQGQQLPERRTLGEINKVVAAGSKRLTVTAKILDAMVFKPLAMRAIANAQQFYDMQQWVRIAGDYAELDPENLGRIQISRSDLAGNFDYVPMSALTSQDPARMMQVWNTLYEMAITNPALSTPDPLDPQVLNVKKLFKLVARLGGAREVDTLFMNLPMMTGAGAAPPGVLPDDQIDQGVQAGNLVPLPTAPGAGQPF